MDQKIKSKVSWELGDYIFPIFPIAYDDENCHYEPEEQIPKPFEHLQMLAQTAARTRETVGLTSEELQTILFEFGLTLVDIAHEDCRLNEDVYEHPADIADKRGNVLMIHKKLDRHQSDLLESVGEELVDLGHQLRSAQKAHDISVENLVMDLDDEDNMSSHDLLEARRQILELRRSVKRLDRRNESLWLRLQKLEERFLKPYDEDRSKIRPPLRMKNSPPCQISTDMSMDESQNHQPRTLIDREEVHSQKDFSFGDEE